MVEKAFAILGGKGKKRRTFPLWNGHAGTRIIKILFDKLMPSG
jgi:hypothetical protein